MTKNKKKSIKTENSNKKIKDNDEIMNVIKQGLKLIFYTKVLNNYIVFDILVNHVACHNSSLFCQKGKFDYIIYYYK